MFGPACSLRRILFGVYRRAADCLFEGGVLGVPVHEEVDDRLSATIIRLGYAEAISYNFYKVKSLTNFGKLKRLRRCQAFSPIVRYGLVNNGTTVEAFPRVKH